MTVEQAIDLVGGGLCAALLLACVALALSGCMVSIGPDGAWLHVEAGGSRNAEVKADRLTVTSDGTRVYEGNVVSSMAENDGLGKNAAGAFALGANALGALP